MLYNRNIEINVGDMVVDIDNPLVLYEIMLIKKDSTSGMDVKIYILKNKQTNQTHPVSSLNFLFRLATAVDIAKHRIDNKKLEDLI